jgi:hypothetical protein
MLLRPTVCLYRFCFVLHLVLAGSSGLAIDGAQATEITTEANNLNCASLFALPLTARAQTLAHHYHSGQSYGFRTMHDHLTDVVAVLVRFGFRQSEAFTQRLLTVAWLHDTLEDTALTYEQIRNYFDKDIADDVLALTNINDPTLSEAIARKLTIKRLVQRPFARIVKLADRIANSEDALKYANRFQNAFYLKLYRSEAAWFQLQFGRDGLPSKDPREDAMLAYLMTILH